MAQDSQRGLKFNKKGKEQPPSGRNYLLVIGINAYEHFAKLNNAVGDAKAIKELLVDRYQFQEEDVRELYDEQATRANILERLEGLESQITQNDNLILFFAGHGTMNARKTKGFWIPVDAEKRQHEYIANSRIKDHLDEIDAHHIYLIVDSCFSGSIISRSTAFSERVETLPSRRVLTSGRNEVVSDGKVGSHSPFANCLITYLKTHSSSLPASELELHVKKHTPRSAAQTPYSAYIHGLGDQGGEFVFHPKQAEESDPKGKAPHIIIPQQTLLKGPIEMLLVEGGTFIMGSPEAEGGRSKNERPHEVTVSTFGIGKYPVTQKEWEEVMGNNPSHFKGSAGRPVERVSWHDIQQYIQNLNTQSGLNYRLPTEAEWEFAARGGNMSKGYRYPGSNRLEEIAWYQENADDQTHAVGQKLPNELGIYDMIGNVWEWCEDWHADYPKEKMHDPKGPNTGSNRVIRGGSWRADWERCTLSLRNYNPPGYYYRDLGFRLAMTLS